MAESDNVLTGLQDLLVYLIPQLNKFPRDQKFVLGDRIETKLLDVQEFCLRAYYSRDNRGHLLEANLQLEAARHLVRLANALLGNLCCPASSPPGRVQAKRKLFFAFFSLPPSPRAPSTACQLNGRM